MSPQKTPLKFKPILEVEVWSLQERLKGHKEGNKEEEALFNLNLERRLQVGPLRAIRTLFRAIRSGVLKGRIIHVSSVRVKTRPPATVVLLACK